MSELKPIKVTDLPEFEYSEDMYMLVSKKVGDAYVSGKMKVSAIGCKCGEVEPPLPDPDKFEDLPKNERSVFHAIAVRGYGEGYNLRSGLSELDYDNLSDEVKDREGETRYYVSTNVSPYVGAVGTYKVLDCDEISVFAKPLRIYTGLNTHGSFCNGLDVRRSDMRRLTNTTAGLSLFNMWGGCIGGYYAWGHAEIRGIFFPRMFSIYTDSSKSERLEGYDVITTPQLLQLLGQLPRYSADYMEDVKDFFCMNTERDSFKLDFPLCNRKNISGLGFYPSGRVPNSDNHNKRPLEVDDFGNMVCFATKRNAGEDQVYLTYLVDKTSAYHPAGLSIASTHAFAHGGNLRYSRTKTADELGYKLVIDGDKILMVDVTDPREDIPTGCLRGVALRYANRANRVITKSYSDIASESAQIMSLFSVNVDV